MNTFSNNYKAVFCYRDINFRVRNAPTFEYEDVFSKILSNAKPGKPLLDSLFGEPVSEKLLLEQLFGQPVSVESPQESQVITIDKIQSLTNVLRPENYKFMRRKMLQLLEFDFRNGKYHQIITETGQFGPQFHDLYGLDTF